MKISFLFLLSWLAEQMFPRGCACCKKPLYEPEDCYYGLCRACRDKFLAELRNDEPRCAVCGKPLVSERETCLACRRDAESGAERRFDRALAVFPYQGRHREILAAYKFGARRGVGRFLACCLAEAAAFHFGALAEGCPWVPVPPRPGKVKKSGWDQIEFWAKVLEGGLSAQAGVGNGGEKRRMPVIRILKRLSSQSQKGLDREKRRENLKGKILAKKPLAVRRALVFDDVYTTGSTLDACAAALKEAGAEEVFGICLFYD